jgi:hypothetical protein
MFYVPCRNPEVPHGHHSCRLRSPRLQLALSRGGFSSRWNAGRDAVQGRPGGRRPCRAGGAAAARDNGTSARPPPKSAAIPSRLKPGSAAARFAEPPGCLGLSAKRLGVKARARARQPLLPAQAIGLGHLSPQLVARRRPRMPVMKVDCQLFTRALSGRSYRRLEESLLHVGGKRAPNGGHRVAESCCKFVCGHSITCWLGPAAPRRRLPPRTEQSDSAQSPANPARPRAEQAMHICKIIPDRAARDEALKRRNDALREAPGIDRRLRHRRLSPRSQGPTRSLLSNRRLDGLAEAPRPYRPVRPVQGGQSDGGVRFCRGPSGGRR